MVQDKLSKEQVSVNATEDHIQPRGTQVFIKYPPKEEAKTASGIILPEAQVKETPNSGVVVRVAPEISSTVAADQIPRAGDKVIFQKGTQTDLFLAGNREPTHCLVAWYDILCVVTE